jgi:hypothetical protein
MRAPVGEDSSWRRIRWNFRSGQARRGHDVIDLTGSSQFCVPVGALSRGATGGEWSELRVDEQDTPTTSAHTSWPSSFRLL